MYNIYQYTDALGVVQRLEDGYKVVAPADAMDGGLRSGCRHERGSKIRSAAAARGGSGGIVGAPCGCMAASAAPAQRARVLAFVAATLAFPSKPV